MLVCINFAIIELFRNVYLRTYSGTLRGFQVATLPVSSVTFKIVSIIANVPQFRKKLYSFFISWSAITDEYINLEAVRSFYL